MKKLIIISILIISCSKKNDPTVIEGTVINGTTNQPIENVEISASELTGGILDISTPGNVSENTTFSKEDGSYSLEISVSESAENYDIVISKMDFCGRFVQSVEAGKTHHIDLELYKSTTINRLYILNNKADSIVENIASKAGIFSIDGGCEDCFIGLNGDENCFEEHPYGSGFSLNRRFGEEWNELEFSSEGIQGFDYYISYELYNEKKLLKRDSLKYFLDENELNIEITLL